MKIVTADEMRRIDEASGLIGLPTSVLMENAGRGVAEEVRRILNDFKREHFLVLVGPGNNGGDGLVAARYLYDWGADVTLYLMARRPKEDANLAQILERDIACIEATEDKRLDNLSDALETSTVVIDAIFGTGKSRALSGIYAQTLNKLNKVKFERHGLKIIALDLPSGMDADNGAVDPATPHADHTITLAFPKIGLYNMPGAERAGMVSIVDIGIPYKLAEDISAELITAEMAASLLPVRPVFANKGTFGKVMVVAGSINYIGAACLACNGALRTGAGLVALTCIPSLYPMLSTKLTEVIYMPVPEASVGVVSPDAAGLIHKAVANFNTLLVGCGLGQAEPTIKFVGDLLLDSKIQLPHAVIDADALHILPEYVDWWRFLPDNTILTPHPGEMARLTCLSVEEVQSNRTSVAQKYAREWNKIVVLKGAYTVVASLDGRLRISPFANPGLASAGTGDVLAGIIAGLAAQGLDMFDAAACGVYLHAQAGEAVRERLGDAGMLASDLLPEIPLAIKRLKEQARA